MKKLILLFIFTLTIPNNTYSIGFECTTNITTGLTSSSNGRFGSFVWQGWACGLNGVIIRSVPNLPYGNPWVSLTNNGVPVNINLTNISAVSEQTAFVCGSNSTAAFVWKTTNSGANFFQVFTQPGGFFNAVFMRNALKGFLVGNPVGGRWSLWKTTNGGLNWDSSGMFLPRAGTENGMPNSLCLPLANYYYPNLSDTNRIWFGTNNHRIYYSSNFGNNWASQIISQEQNINCICFGYTYTTTDVPVLYAGGDTCLLKSTNYGLNWTNITIPGSGKITGVTDCTYNPHLARGNKIYIKSYGSSENWYQFYVSPSGNYVYFDNRGYEANFIDHYAVRDNGGITFFSEGEDIRKIASSIPSSLELFQNYPNPFNPTTKIQFQIPPSRRARGMMEVKLAIYDVLGKLVTDLTPLLGRGSEGLLPGTYEVEWDGTNYPSGLYFYKLECGDFSEVKKMVLIK